MSNHRTAKDIVRVTSSIVKRLSLRLDNNLVTIDDLVSVAYLAYDKALSSFQGCDKDFDVYWYGVARRDIIQYLRKTTLINYDVRDKYSKMSIDDNSCMKVKSSYNDDYVEAKTDKSLIRDFINNTDKLNSLYKKILIDSLFNDKTTGEIAKELQLNVQSTYVAKNRAMDIIKREFNDLSNLSSH